MTPPHGSGPSCHDDMVLECAYRYSKQSVVLQGASKDSKYDEVLGLSEVETSKSAVIMFGQGDAPKQALENAWQMKEVLQGGGGTWGRVFV